MRVYQSLSELTATSRPAALTIGNFDGVHIGHQWIMRRVAALGQVNGAVPSVLTFDPHPAKVVAAARAPRLLNTLEERIDLMEKHGIEQVVVLRFDEAFAAITAESFVKDVLVDGLGAKAVVVGDNFRFGSKQSGNIEMLQRLGLQYGFTTEFEHPVSLRGRTVSSTGIRQLLGVGNVSLAGRLLGRPYALTGTVVSGRGIGKKQTVPTLNLQTGAEVLPANGVYITATTDLDSGKQWNSVTNVGVRPTFEGDSLSVETFVLQSLEGATPARIRVAFLRKVRDEIRFPSPEALKEQILRDVARASVYFRRRLRFVPGGLY